MTPISIRIKNLFLLPVVTASLGLIPPGRLTAQTFTTLHSFTKASDSTNSDGGFPYKGLILSGNTLYGMAHVYGGAGYGTVFAVKTDGTGFTNLHDFDSSNDGQFPDAGLILSGQTLYGTAESGGSFSRGTVFKVNTNGTGFAVVHDFPVASDGSEPHAGLILSGNVLYGTAASGGDAFNGTVFKVNTDGTGFTILHSFTDFSSPPANSDGSSPHAGLVLSGNTLYGTASAGGSSGYGTVFAVNTNGTGFLVVHDFTGGTSDGAEPFAGLVLSGNTLYGTAKSGGSSGNGTVFAVKTDGTGFTNLHSFTGLNNSTNSDGANPQGGLILSGDTLYGTAVFGGISGNGTVFSLSLPPPPSQLAITLSGANVILTWPTNAAGFSLQSTTNLVSPAVWTAVSPAPMVVNGQNTVTNPASGPQQFYRLNLLPAGMALIPAGAFTMGDTLDGLGNAVPVSATVSAFYMDVNLVSYSQWQSVYSFATNHGYGFVHAGAGKAANHPVQTVDWYDVVKWSNARSAQAGLTPVYYTDAGLTQVYTNGEVTTLYPNWAVSGYRLPTEAEWEKAARGGLSGQRFPWGNLIGESQANYYGNTSYSYDSGPNGYNPIGIIGGTPATSPVGSFAANGYGLYDMAGNVFEWCWDWYGTPYAGGSDPRGPAGPLSLRVLRGGSWGSAAPDARCAARFSGVNPGDAYFVVGFRCVRGFTAQAR